MREQAKPDLGELRIAGAKVSADLSDVIKSVSISRTTGEVPELTVVGTDRGNTLIGSKLATVGTTITFDGVSWQVGTIAGAFLGEGVEYTFKCRSKVARTMRRTYNVRADRNVSATSWVTSRVGAAGGKAVCQPTSKKAAISQSGGDKPQSELDVMKSLASENGFEWVEVDGTIYFGSKHWAWAGGTGRPTWPVTWGKDPASDALSLEVSRSDDDYAAVATASLTLPYDFGLKVRPWDRVQLTQAGPWNGLWLVESVEQNRDFVTPASVSLIIPRKPRPKRGSKPRTTVRTDTTW